MFEHEQLSDDALAGAGERQNAHRVSTYLVGQVEANEHVTASATCYVQPRLDRPRDLRVLGEAALATALSSHVTFKTALVVAHDAEPPPEIEQTDVSVLSAFAAKF